MQFKTYQSQERVKKEKKLSSHPQGLAGRGKKGLYILLFVLIQFSNVHLKLIDGVDLGIWKPLTPHPHTKPESLTSDGAFHMVASQVPKTLRCLLTSLTDGLLLLRFLSQGTEHSHVR